MCQSFSGFHWLQSHTTSVNASYWSICVSFTTVNAAK